MLCAHMDAPGLLVTDPSKDGSLRLSPVGTLQATHLPGLVVVNERDTIGVVGVKPGTEPKDPAPAKMHIDIGAGDEGAARDATSAGDVFVPRPATLVEVG